ncbi:MAG TPA: hypothetical protein DCS93_12835, partial [Microscillaceae bacterium]|nr:hypothetical protein [Microscillaceae bacterium]
YLGLPEPVLDAPYLPDDPFVSLKPYTQKEAKIFFGRGWEIRQLYHFVKDPQSPPMMLLMGQSGVGKSSLLHAGLLPRLRQAYQVRYIRRSTREGILDAFYQIFPDLPSLTASDLLGTWKGYEQASQKPMVLILDQLEEIFTKPPKREKAADTPPKRALEKEHPKSNPQKNETPAKVLSPEEELNALLTLIQQVFLDPENQPQGKIILSYRKEHSPEIEDKIKRLEIPNRQFLLFPFQASNLREVITGMSTTKQLKEKYQIAYEDHLPQLMIHDLLADKSSPIAPMLQILLAKMWEATKHNHPREFDAKLYASLKREGLHLRDFLRQQLAKVAQDKTFAPYEANGLALDVLYFHTTSLGTANTRSSEAILGWYEGTPEERNVAPRLDWDQFIELLVKLRLLARQDDGSTSLGHDTLAPLVIEAYRKYEKPGPHATLVLETTLKNNQAIPKKSSKVLLKAWKNKLSSDRLIYLDNRELKIVKAGIEGMRKLHEEEEGLVKRSKNKRSRERWSVFSVCFALIVSAAIIYFLELTRIRDKKEAQVNLEVAKDSLTSIRQQKARADDSLTRIKDERNKTRQSLRAVQIEKRQTQDSLGKVSTVFLTTKAQLSNAQTTKKAVNLTIQANKLRNEAIVLKSSYQKKITRRGKKQTKKEAINEVLEEAIQLAKAAYQIDSTNPVVATTLINCYYDWTNQLPLNHPSKRGLLLPNWQATRELAFHQQFTITKERKGKQRKWKLKISRYKLGTSSYEKGTIPSTVENLVYSPQSRRIAHTRSTGRIYLRHKGKSQGLPRGLKASKLVFSPRGQRLAAIGKDGDDVLIIDVNTLRPLPPTVKWKKVSAFHFLNEQILLFASGNAIYQYTVGQPKPTFLFNCVAGKVDEIICSPDQQYVLVMNKTSPTIEIYDQSQGFLVQSIHLPKLLTDQKITWGGRFQFDWTKLAFSKDAQEIYLEAYDRQQGDKKVLIVPLLPHILQILQNQSFNQEK